MDLDALARSSAWRPADAAKLERELAHQARAYAQPSGEDLAELAAVLLPRLATAGGPPTPAGALDRPSLQPLWHFYRFALHREAGERDAALHALGECLALDPGDPPAVLLHAHLTGEPVPSVTPEERLANVVRTASSALLTEPYRQAVRALFDAIRDRERARVLDVGVGAGTQFALLLELLATRPNGVRRLELVGLDLLDEYLGRAGETVREAAAGLPGVQVSYEPVRGRAETLTADEEAAIRGGGLHVANASLCLHEIGGAGKLAALGSLRRLAPGRLVVTEWNACTEDVLAPEELLFLFNVRHLTAAMVGAVRGDHGLEGARASVSTWLGQGEGQLTAPATRRQECFLPAGAWQAVLREAGFEPESPVPDGWPALVVQVARPAAPAEAARD